MKFQLKLKDRWKKLRMKQKKETAREQDRQKQNKKWKKNSRPKKFHSLKHQISVLFICLLLLSIFTITLINGLFLEKYYVSKKVEVLEEAKSVLSQMNLDDILKYDADSEEDTGETPVEIPDEIEKSSSRNNLTWIVVNEENS